MFHLGGLDLALRIATLAEGESVSLSRDAVPALQMTYVDKTYFALLVLVGPIVTLFCLVLCAQMPGDFSQARVFNRQSVQRTRTIGWTLLVAWLVSPVLQFALQLRTGANPLDFTLRLDGVPSSLIVVATVFLAAWILDIGRALDCQPGDILRYVRPEED